jgi:hypothetical protein
MQREMTNIIAVRAATPKSCDNHPSGIFGIRAGIRKSPTPAAANIIINPVALFVFFGGVYSYIFILYPFQRK